VFLQARVSGLPVAQGTIGPIPPGTAPRLIKLNLQYDLPQLRGLSLDTQIEHNSSLWGNRVNTLRIPSVNTVAIGTRYSFSTNGVRATLRFQVQNLFNDYDWTVEGNSGRLTPTYARRYMVRIATDF
jgi:iron complex outermembrane receptor protein